MSMPISHEAFLREVALRAERTGAWLLDEECVPSIPLTRLRETTRAYVERPGKRLRPALLLFSCAAAGGDESRALPAAAAVELFHTWSLVHDDIIDNDDLRRGKPTAHRVARSLAMDQLGSSAVAAEHYGLSAAILAGDIQLAWAARMLLRCRDQGVEADVVLDLAARLTGQLAPELIDGEMMDVEFSYRPLPELTEEDVLRMQERKTGALLGYAASAGACIGAGRPYADCAEAQALDGFARACGIAFQLQDDVLGIVGDERQLGKPVGSDLREGKATAIVLHAMGCASPEQRACLLAVLGQSGVTAERVREATCLLRELGSVDYARLLAHRYIDRALLHLAEIPGSPSRDLLAAWAGCLIDRTR